MVQQKLRCNSCNAIVSDDISLKHCPTCRSSSVRLDPVRSRKEIQAIREEMKHPKKPSSTESTSGGTDTSQDKITHSGTSQNTDSKKENSKNNNKQNTKNNW